jgi:hypothetical protein
MNEARGISLFEELHRRLASQERGAEVSFDRDVELVRGRLRQRVPFDHETGGVDEAIERAPAPADRFERVTHRSFLGSIDFDRHCARRRRMTRERCREVHYRELVARAETRGDEAATDAAAASENAQPPLAHRAVAVPAFAATGTRRRARSRTDSI